MKKNDPIGHQIADMRLKRGLTQAALAEAAGISLDFIKSIESLRREPSKKIIKNICSALGCEYIQEIKDIASAI